MKYFLTAAGRKKAGGSCYFEFQNGTHYGKHWLKDSLYLHADKFDEVGFYQLFSASIANFNYYGPTEVDKEQWEKLVVNSLKNEDWNEIIRELAPWAEECFKKHRCFTLLGI